MGYLPVDGKKLRSLRDTRGFSSAERLGEAAGKYLDGGTIRKRTIERYEAGESGRPDYIQAIAKALEVNWTELLTPEALRIIRDYSPTFITGSTEEEIRLLYKSFECYSRIFPKEQDRIGNQEIEEYIHRSHLAEYTNYPWRDLYGVLHAGDDVIGMAYIYVHRIYPWAFGAYLGLTADERVKDRGVKFLHDIVKQVQSINPQVKAIIFDIDPIDFNVLDEAVSHLDHIDINEQLLATLIAARRLLFFQSKCFAKVVLGADARPLPYWSHSMEDPNNFTEETSGVEKILMIKNIGENKITDSEISEIINFICDEIYLYFPDDENENWIPKWVSHISKLRSRMLERIGEGNINKLGLPDRIFTLLSRLKGQLDL